MIELHILQILRLEGPQLCRRPPPKDSLKLMKKHVQTKIALSPEMKQIWLPVDPKIVKNRLRFFLLPKTGIVSACAFFSPWMLPGLAATVKAVLIPR